MNPVQTLEKDEKRTAAEVQTGATEDELEVSVVMPCLNEAETLAICIKKAADALRQANIAGEIIVADNGSSHGSHEIAKQPGARVIHLVAKGYGNALLTSIAA